MASITYEIEIVEPEDTEDLAFLAGVGLSALRGAMNDVRGTDIGEVSIEFEM